MSEHADKILATIGSGDDVSSLAASWRRCRTLHGIDPDRTYPPERDSRGWHEGCERSADLIAVAQPYLDQLFQIMADAECGVFLGDRHGMFLDMRTNRKSDPWNRRPEDYLGTTYSERALGTNAVGTCLAEERGVLMRANNHFLSRYTHLNTFGAPIFGPDGALCGCLSISEEAVAHDARLDAFLSIALGTLARRIEIELFAAAFPKARLVLASMGTSVPGALVAVDNYDCVMGATRAARRLLDLSDDAIACAISLDTLFEMQPDDGGAMAAAERRTIERTIARTGGNLSAAAKTMGISRSTLYRKMSIYEVPRGRV